MWNWYRGADFRENMCAFLSQPHQANPHLLHLFERRNLFRTDISSATGGRAHRPFSNTLCSSRKFPQQLSSRTSRKRFSQSIPELSNPCPSNFSARSLGNWGFEFLQAESPLTLFASDIPLQSTEISNLYIFLSRFLRDLTTSDVLSFTFVSTVLGIMAAYIVHELKDNVDSPTMGLLDYNRQSNPHIVNSPPTLRNGETETADIWLNLSRPTPFFRSVCARCPTLSSSTAGEYVQKARVKKPEFQRQCLPAPDGGTVALDWPSHLDIGGNKELENIMLHVCGTTEGSHEDGIVTFSQLVEQHGYFPIVFNPRGCGGSPLTTPRVFSAADSDDVRLAVQFITKSRPWASMLGIGWGMGANLLARYLGEEGSYTPLTAAVCIDNPFDLSSVTRPTSGSRWVDFDQSLSKGLVQILKSSKMLFQGEKRGFDVSGALGATSVRDFDQAISRVVHGYTTVEDFYVNTSSGATLEGVRIPLLCIQHLEDYTRTQASIPHQVFERNAYTMLLLSSPSDSRVDHVGGASEWTHAISLEVGFSTNRPASLCKLTTQPSLVLMRMEMDLMQWLTAVEISLLKGRHPHISEFTPTIKLPREWRNAENQFSGASLETSLQTMDKKVATAVPGTASGNSHHKGVAVEEADMETNSTVDPSISHLEKEESTGRSAVPSNASNAEGAKASKNLADFEEAEQAEQQLSGEGLSEAEEAERGQVVQVAETVMNVLDVTMPGTLVDAQKQQVLKAVGRGETIVTALEEAVPEDVRGKMSTAVAEVVSAQGLSLKMMEGKLPAPILPAGMADSIQGKLVEFTGEKVAPKSDVDMSSSSGKESSNDTGTSGKAARSDDTTKGISPGRNDTSSNKDKPSLNDETKDSDKGKVATRGDENLEPSKVEHMLFKDPRDCTQQLETGNKSGGGIQGSGDALSSGSPNVENQTHDQGDQGKNKQEQPRGPADGPVEETKETSGWSLELTRHSDNSADKFDSGESGQGHSTATERNDSAKDMKGQADSEEVNGRSVNEKNAKSLKYAESKGEVTTPNNDDSLTTQNDPPKAPGTTPSTQTPDPQMPQSDPTSTEGPADRSLACDSQARPGTDVPADTNNSPSPSSLVSQIDPLRSDVSAEASNSQPSTSQASQSDAQHSETSTVPPRAPPENSPPAPQNPSPQSPAPENQPPQSPPVPLPSVGEALQALTGFDDSTQMAVTNVFGVVESVLDQLEKESPSADANSASKVSEESMLNPSTAELTKELDPNPNNPEDEDRIDQGNNDKHSKEVALAPNNLYNGSHLQSLAERRRDRNDLNSTEFPVEVERVEPENRFSCITAGSRGVKPCLSKNRRGFIKDATRQQAEPVSHAVQESTSEKRLAVMAAEIDAEGEETAESLPSDQVAADNCVTGVRGNDSSMVADLVMNALKLELVRRLGAAGLEALGVDLETEVAKVAHAISEVVTMGKNKLLGVGSNEWKGTQGLDSNLRGKVGVLNGNSIVTALGSVLGSNSLLGRFLPFGVLSGVVMAALGATYLIVADDQEEESNQTKRSSSQTRHDTYASSSRRSGLASANYRGEPVDEASEELGAVLAEVGQDGAENIKHSISSEEGEEWNEVDGVNDSPDWRDRERKSSEQTAGSKPPHQGKLMGAMAAAMGATAAVASSAKSTSEGQSSDSERKKGGEQKLVPEIAEKAISMVSPVVPRTEAGHLDHERLVAVLTEVGQKGGPLTLVGKVALLWGGLRGAMSLADRLLAFLRIKERPLHQRLLGFGGMALLLWTPVLVPLLPTLLQQWATKSPSGVADAAAGIGLYGAVFILVTIWGRRVRGYDRPLVSYGLQLFSRAKLRLFAGGLAIGLGTVSGYYGINWVLGYSQFAWDAIVVTNQDFPGALASTILTSWKVLMLVTQSLTMAVAVALVEEVLFRAWLQEEMAVDLGYHWAVVLSALAFAVVHWSPAAVAGLWFLAVALAGARARTNGDLSFPIGIHAGLVTAFSVINLEGLVRYIPDTPTWITGEYAANPLAGALGTGMVAALAVALYPRQQVRFPEEK